MSLNPSSSHFSGLHSYFIHNYKGFLPCEFAGTWYGLSTHCHSPSGKERSAVHLSPLPGHPFSFSPIQTKSLIFTTSSHLQKSDQNLRRNGESEDRQVGPDTCAGHRKLIQGTNRLWNFSPNGLEVLNAVFCPTKRW